MVVAVALVLLLGDEKHARPHGRVVLLSFLDTRAKEGNDPSRAQVVFLRSMQAQHARYGLRVIIVDASALAGGRKPTRSELINYRYDSHLDPAIAVLADNGSRARRFRVRKPPVTLLIGPDGEVSHRWNGFASAAELDLAIRALEGRSPAG